MAYATANLTPRRNDGVKVAPGQSGEQRSGTWLYHSTADALATVRVAGYFSDAVTKKIEVGDDIIVTASDGSAVMKAVGYNGNTLYVHDQSQQPDHFDISLAASGTTDGLEATFTLKSATGETLTTGQPIIWWISESSDGSGLTGDSYSGDVTTPSVGTELSELTAKKAFIGLTSTAGLLTALAVDSANPADQYFCCLNPNGSISVSDASGTNWEGA